MNASTAPITTLRQALRRLHQSCISGATSARAGIDDAGVSLVLALDELERRRAADATDTVTDYSAWIQGTDGAPIITPLDLKPEQIDLDDIVHSLANLCRYTGRTRRFYSVAEHSLIVWQAAVNLGLSVEGQRWAIAHDFGEAYLNDISAPLKRTPVFDRYRAVEAEIDRRIRARFNINVSDDEIARVRQIDVEACNVERRVLLPPEPRSWNLPAVPDHVGYALNTAWMQWCKTDINQVRWDFARIARKVVGT